MIQKIKISIAFLVILTGFVFTVSCNHENTPVQDASANPDADSVLLKSVKEKNLNFIVFGDWGRNGYFNQADVAKEMGKIAEEVEVKFIISAGDNFQINGVQSTSDPLWMTSYESIYNAPSLLDDWYPVLGNHDYKGSTQAEIDYSNISRRWRMPSHYYSMVKKLDGTDKALFIFLDTPALVDEYYSKPEGYKDITKQDSSAQLKWLTELLRNSTEKWKIVIGHHPVFSASKTHGDTRELIARLKPLFDKYGVDIYFCGHDHDFEHARPKGSNVDYFVTGTGSELREASSNNNTVFTRSLPGFTYVSLSENLASLYFISKDGKVIYSYIKKK